MNNDSSHAIQEICLRLLARREHSRKELAEKLRLRGFSSDESQAVLDRLAEQGWQSDERYAECFARQRIQNGYGPVKIAYELQQRGGGEVDLDALVAELKCDWMELARQVYSRKYPHTAQMNVQEWHRRSRFLQQRGFSGDLIRALFAQLDIRLER